KHHEQARAQGVNADKEVRQGVQLPARKTLRKRGNLDQEGRAKEKHFADREQGGRYQSKERRQQSQISVDRLEQDVQNQGERNIAERLEQVAGKAESKQHFMVENVAQRRRRVSRHDQLARHVELAKRAGNERNQKHDSCSAGIGLYRSHETSGGTCWNNE